MTIADKIQTLVQLKSYLQEKDERLHAHLHRTAYNNKWFTIEQQHQAIELLCEHVLNETTLQLWSSQLPTHSTPKTIGILPNAHVPLSAFEAMIATFLAGHIAVVKLPEDDTFLIPFLIKKMKEISSGVNEIFRFEPQFKMASLDGIIAQSEPKLVPYLNKYFKEKPSHIQAIQRSLAVIHGAEDLNDFRQLAKDTLTFFGRGEKNISKLYIPEGYDFNTLLEAFHESNDIIRNDAYKNNYDYQISLLILNQTTYWNNGSIILAEQDALESPISVLNYTTYKDEADLQAQLKAEQNLLQIVSQQAIAGFETVTYGESLYPNWLQAENESLYSFFNAMATA